MSEMQLLFFPPGLIPGQSGSRFGLGSGKKAWGSQEKATGTLLLLLLLGQSLGLLQGADKEKGNRRSCIKMEDIGWCILCQRDGRNTPTHQAHPHPSVSMGTGPTPCNSSVGRGEAEERTPLSLSSLPCPWTDVLRNVCFLYGNHSEG